MKNCIFYFIFMEFRHKYFYLNIKFVYIDMNVKKSRATNAPVRQCVCSLHVFLFLCRATHTQMKTCVNEVNVLM